MLSYNQEKNLSSIFILRNDNFRTGFIQNTKSIVCKNYKTFHK
jgi:hypothetical protein